jgi:hypothetical protein
VDTPSVLGESLFYVAAKFEGVAEHSCHVWKRDSDEDIAHYFTLYIVPNGAYNL